MKKKELMRAFYFLIIQICFVSFSFAQSSGQKLESFGRQIITEIQSSDFDGLVQYFDIPNTYTAQEAEKRKLVVITNLKNLIQNQIGSFIDFSKIDSPPTETIMYFPFAIDNSKKEAADFTKLFYKVEFAQFGTGYIVIWIPKDSPQELLIKMIEIGLPAANPKAMDIYGEFTKFVLEGAQESTSPSLQEQSR